MAYPSLTTGPKLLKIKTKNDEIEELRYKAEKHDYENILKSLKIDKDYYKEIKIELKETSYYIISSTLSIVNPRLVFR